MKYVLLFCAVLILLPVASVMSQEEEETNVTEPCCFTRIGYQGICKVVPGEGETCESILEYLNTPETVGKAYCGGNKLRGGWELVNCDAAETEEPSDEEASDR